MKKFFYTLFFCWMMGSNLLSAQCPAGESFFELSIQADDYPQEISWDLVDGLGNVVASENTIPGDTIYNHSICVPSNECLTFTIYDSFGDGICCNFGNGSYQVSLDGNLIIDSDGQYGEAESTQLACPPGTSCADPFIAMEGTQTDNANMGNTWYIFTPSQTGMFELNTCDGNITCGNTTIWIYDYCNGLIWDDTNEGAIFYSDEDCEGALSSMSAALVAGETYYVRIKYDNDGCANMDIPWTITYSGAITGCTDPTACNYNPLATESDGSCIFPGDPDCPGGPDLIVVHGALVSSMYVAYLENNDACLIQEGCVAGYGQREVIRFTTHIKNIGDADYYIGAPQENSQWEWDPCHGHWHYEGYAEYVMYNMDDGNEIPIGFKNGFCVMDLECDDGGTYQYGCGNQGISKQCGDIYSSGLQCQWIDITDLEAGQYMLVVRVNWDQSPDLLGQVEPNYENNWAQVCLDITRDPVTNEASFEVLSECDPYEDCLGNLYGNAQPDCTGVCAGVVITGDINQDNLRSVPDLTTYMLESLLDTITPTQCLDLNADGEITVTDATLLYDCVLHGNGPIPSDHQHTPCEYPYGVQNPTDEATLTIAELNEPAGYFDIHIKNPNGRILSFEFDITGVEIDYVTNHVQDYFPNIMYDENEIIGVSYDESTINKNSDFIPFLRVHYSAILDDEICIGNITDFVNDDHEEMIHSIDNGCVVPEMFLDVEDLQLNPFAAFVTPNPMASQGRLVFNNDRNETFTLEILDISGRQIHQITNVTGTETNLDASTWETGVYIFKLSNGEKLSVGRFVVEK